jgi:tetratricopeptide (TPR) repeat protein
MSRIHKILFLLVFILAAFSPQGVLALFRQNLVDLAYLPAATENSKDLSHPFGPETCRQTWLRTAAGSADPAYFIPPGDVAAILGCGTEYVSLLSAIQPANYEVASLAVARYPDNPSAWFWLGQTAEAFDWKIAQEAYSHMVQLEPSNGLAWCRLAEHYENYGQFQAAADAYLSCCRNGDPGYIGCSGAGRMMEKLGNPRQAIAYYRLSKWPKAQERADALESQLGAGN